MLLVAALSSVAVAQHSDIEFALDDFNNPTGIVVTGDEFTSEGIQFFESEFEEDPFTAGLFSTEDPGFEGEVNAGDLAFLRILDASVESSFGVGFVNYFNPNTGALEASGRISVEQDQTTATSDLILSGGSIESGDNPQLASVGDSVGEAHDHLVFDLLDDSSAPFGAYGLLAQLEVNDVESDPFWIIINHQLSEEDFEGPALAAFGVSAVPEPAAAILLMGVTGAILTRRRRRND